MESRLIFAWITRGYLSGSMRSARSGVMRALRFRRALAILAFLLAAEVAWGESPLLPASGFPPPRNQVLFLGDSLTAGHGLAARESFPAVIGRYWERRGISLVAVNGGVSGATSLDVLARLDHAVSPRTCLVFLEIGPNDGFRRRAPEAIATTIAEIVHRLESQGIPVALAGMWLPMQAASSDAYRERFDALYGEIGAGLAVPVMSGFLRSLVDRPEVWQSDGLHPTAAGQRILARDTLSFLNPSWSLEPVP